MQFDSAKTYLARVLPWAPLGKNDSFINIHWAKLDERNAKRVFFNGRACSSIDECIKTIAWANKLPGTIAVYACMSTQKEFEDRIAKNGTTHYRNAIRQQSNAVELRSLFLDIDVEHGNKSGKAYPSAQEAMKALAGFLKLSGLPRPNVVVASGSGGFHVYWTLAAALSPEEWQPLANALVEATRRCGLVCDTGCTIDSARLLRVPETFNKKDPTRVTVTKLVSILPHDYSLDQIRNALVPFMGAQVLTLPQRGKAPGLNSELSGGIERAPSLPIDLQTVAAAGCGFIGDALANGGANYANPLWNLTTLVSTFAEGGRKMAHAMSSSHPTYDATETDQLFDRKVEERATKNLGWPSCQTIENSGCKACATCSLKGAGTRPLQFGSPAARVAAPVAHITPLQFGSSTLALPGGTIQQPATSGFPNGFIQDPASLIVSQVIPGPRGTTLQEVAPYPVFNAWLQANPWTLNFTTRLTHTTTETQIRIPLDAAHSQDFGKRIGAQGLSLNKTQLVAFKEFVLSFIAKLQQTRDKVISSAPYGWTVGPKGDMGFSFGGLTHEATGSRPSAVPSEALAAQYTPTGQLQTWIDAARAITDQRRPALDVFLAAAFAGPLVRFTGHAGLLVTTYSAESGLGKSTALDIATAVWGQPRGAKQQLNDTQNSVFGKIGSLKHLPVFWDELKTEEDTKRFVQIAFQLSSGKEKSRMTADASVRTPATWQTLVMAASNDSILEYIVRLTKTTTAGAYRTFEYVVPGPKPTNLSSSFVSQMIGELNENYGNAGLVYARFLGAYPDRVKKDVIAKQEEIEKLVKGQSDERFWIATVAVMIMGATYSNELELTDIDINAMRNFLVRTLLDQRKGVKAQPVDMNDIGTVGTILQQFISAKRSRNTIVTDKLPTGAGRPSAGSINVIGDISKLDALQVQIAVDLKVIRISNIVFRDWLHDNGMSVSTIVSALKKHFPIKIVTGKLGGGTTHHFVGGVESLIEIDVNNTVLANIAE